MLRYKQVRFGFTLLLLASIITSGSKAQAQKPFTVEDLLRLKIIVTTSLSPDASQVLYPIDEADLQKNTRRRSIWVVDVTGNAPKKLADDAIVGSQSPAWSRDGKQFAYTSARDGNTEIWLMNPTNRGTRKLTSGKSDIRNFAWSPAAQSIAYIVSPSAPTKKTNDGIRFVSKDDPPPAAAEFHLINVETGEDKLVMKPELVPDDFSFSPDGKQIVFSANADIFVVNLENGRVRKLVSRDGFDTSPQFSPDGKKIAFVTNYGQWGAKLSFSVIDAGGKTPPQDNYKDFDFGFGGYPPRFFAWSADGKSLLVSALSRMRQNLYALSLATGESRQITTGENKVFHDFSFSNDGRTFAFLATDSTSPSEVYISSISDFNPKQLTREINPQLAGIAFGKSEVVRWVSKDGLEIEGLLMKPINFEKGKKYPLLVQMEGTYGTYDVSFSGRVSADSPGAVFPFQQQIFAGQGYLVLMPNPRGSWGYGEQFLRRGRGDYGIGPYNDIISGVDYVIAQGIADSEKIGIMGMSFDGYRAAFAITQTNRFKAASVGQIYGFNLASWYGQVPDFAGRIFGGPPWQVPNNYTPISPVNFAGNLKTPTFIFHLTEPDWVAAQSQEFYTALKQNKVPVEYVIYEQNPSEFFGATKLNQWKDIVRRNVDWFNRWLK